jgi:hypothetical protein
VARNFLPQKKLPALIGAECSLRHSFASGHFDTRAAFKRGESKGKIGLKLIRKLKKNGQKPETIE